MASPTLPPKHTGSSTSMGGVETLSLSKQEATSQGRKYKIVPTKKLTDFERFVDLLKIIAILMIFPISASFYIFSITTRENINHLFTEFRTGIRLINVSKKESLSQTSLNTQIVGHQAISQYNISQKNIKENKRAPQAAASSTLKKNGEEGTVEKPVILSKFVPERTQNLALITSSATDSEIVKTIPSPRVTPSGHSRLTESMTEEVIKAQNLDEEVYKNKLIEEQNKLLQEARNFIQEARKDITKISIVDLEKELNKALKIASKIKDPGDKTTLLTVAERIAQSYINASNFDKALEIRLQAAQAITPAPPLADLRIALQKEDPKLGLKLYPIDTYLFKNHTLGVQKRKYTDGPPELHFNAKLSHPARQQLETSLNNIKKDPMKLLKALPKGFCTDVKLSTDVMTYQGKINTQNKWGGDYSHDISKNGYSLILCESCTAQIIHFEGVGKVKIGVNTGNWNFDFVSECNRITIELDPNITEELATEKLNIIFAALGLAAASSLSRTEDIERIKVMQLFRAFYPREAYAFERDANTFVESVESLKNRISKQVVKMKDKFQHYFVDHPEDMYEQEIYPGQTAWAVRGLSEDVKKAGAIGLMMGVTADNFNDAASRTVSLLQAGSLSTQDRFQLGIIAKGASSSMDLKIGGGESVFLRMITNSMPKNLNSYLMAGHIQILYDLDLVERVGYAYFIDKFGTKLPSVYKNRPNIVELTNKIEADPNGYMRNEICIRHRIAPKFIKGVQVNSFTEKDQLVKTLKKEGMVTQNSQNQECLNDIPLDQFIRVGDVKAEYWA